MFSESKEGSNEKNFAKPFKTLGANSIRHNPYIHGAQPSHDLPLKRDLRIPLNEYSIN